MNSLSFRELTSNPSIFFAFSLWIHYLFCEITIDQLLFSRSYFEFIIIFGNSLGIHYFFANSLWIYYFFRVYTMDPLSSSPIRYTYFEFIISFGNSLGIHYFFANSLWIYYFFREFTMAPFIFRVWTLNSLFLSRINSQSVIFFANSLWIH